MKGFNLKVAGLTLACGSLLFSGGLWADATGQVGVSGDVSLVCSITSPVAADIDYDYVVTNRTANKDTTAGFTIACTTGSGITIKLAGLQDDGDGAHVALNGTEELNYFTYSNAGYSTLWGSTTSVAYTGTGSGQAQTIYVRAPGGQNVPVGSYSDTLTVTAVY